jgi:hypothetical protein
VVILRRAVGDAEHVLTEDQPVGARLVGGSWHH